MKGNKGFDTIDFLLTALVVIIVFMTIVVIISLIATKLIQYENLQTDIPQETIQYEGSN